MKSATRMLVPILVLNGIVSTGLAQQEAAAIPRQLGEACSQGQIKKIRYNRFELRVIDPAEKRATRTTPKLNAQTEPLRITTLRGVSRDIQDIRLIQAENSDLDELLRDITNDAKEGPLEEQGLQEIPNAATPARQEDASATSELDDLLRQAKDLIKIEDAVNQLPSDTPAEAAEKAEQEAEELRSNLRDELDKLLPEDRDEEDPDTRANADDDDELDQEALDELEDPKPQPVYRSHRNANQPYTLSAILTENDQPDPQCVAEYCRRVWECAGGRNQRPLSRLRRDWSRNQNVIWGRGGGSQCSPMAGFGPCPLVPADDCQCNNGVMGGGMNGYAPAPISAPPATSPVAGDSGRSYERLPIGGVPKIGSLIEPAPFRMLPTR